MNCPDCGKPLKPIEGTKIEGQQAYEPCDCAIAGVAQPAPSDDAIRRIVQEELDKRFPPREPRLPKGSGSKIAITSTAIVVVVVIAFAFYLRYFAHVIH